jgi:hypothetical protein
MFHSSIRHSTIRILLLAGILQSLALACDLKSPVDPDTTGCSALQVPDHVMYSVVPETGEVLFVAGQNVDAGNRACAALRHPPPGDRARQPSEIGSCTTSVQTRSYAAK